MTVFFENEGQEYEELRAREEACQERVGALEAALRAIAAPDGLLDANEGAFNVHAARRMQAQARDALKGTP